MANAENIKETVAKFLGCVEKVSSFASSIDPMFGIVSSLVGVARKGLVDEESHALEKDFQAVQSKLETISKKNQKCLKMIRIHNLNETYGTYEERIKHQYQAFNTMVAQVKTNPQDTKRFFEKYEEIYERDKSDMNLNEYYHGVIGTARLFKGPLLAVYFDACDGDLETMEYHCSHIAHLFHIGLIALMAYTAVTEDDEDEIRERWAKRVLEIQQEMQKVLSQCKPKTS